MKKLFFIGYIFAACASPSAKEKDTVKQDSVTVADSLAAIKDKAMNDELRIYNGQFEWHPEGAVEGSGSLSLKYNENREFNFSLSTSINECGANLEGILFADRSQHAFYKSDSCFIHFNFLNGDTVEIIEEKCTSHRGECGFAGDYVRAKE